MSWLDIITAAGSIAVLICALLHPLHGRDNRDRNGDSDVD
jgi:hypothetical protein